jgi:site-specific DNA-methyltransferase (adenine-specific)
MQWLAPASVDVVVTSPPYNIGLAYRSYGDRRAEEDYLDWMMGVATAIQRVMRPDASFFLNITGSSAMPWLPFELIVRLRSLFRLQNHITWVKSISIGDETVGHFKPINSTRFLHRNHEHIFHLTQSGSVPLKRLAVGVPFKDKTNITRRGHAQDLRCRGDSWFIPYETVRNRAQKFDHPGTFPIMLPRMCLRLHGKPSAVVLDPFMGTGTTLLAAEEEGARGIGIDLDASYVGIARNRLLASMKAMRAA